jgi:hypothetical protein
MLKFPLAIALILLCILKIAHAQSQNYLLEDWSANRGEAADPARTGGLSFNLRSNWRSDLEKSGALSRFGPYRVGLPLASFGDNGPKLVLTYLPRPRDGLGADKAVMLFLRINID